MRKVLYLGWLGFNNLGDEMMWQLFKEYAQQSELADQVELIPSVPGVQTKDMSEYDTVVLGGGSLLVPGYVDRAYDALKLGKKVIVWGSGFDSMEMDPHQSAIANQGLTNMLSGLAKGAAFFGVRGPLTYEFLKLAGIPMDNIMISGDPAIIMNRPNTLQMDRTGEIAINWGTVYNKLLGHDEIRVENELAAVAREWVDQGHRLYLYAVWGPDRAPLKRLAEKIGESKHVYVEKDLLSKEKVVDKLRNCSFSVNLKLHANLLSFAAETPFFSLGYRYKCFDFVRSVDLLNFIIPTDSSELTLRLRKAPLMVEARRRDIIGKIRKYRDQYTPLILQPFTDQLM